MTTCCRSFACQQVNPTDGIIGRYEVVCAGCEPTHLNYSRYSIDIVDVATIPDCKELPTGVSSGTTMATFNVKKGYYRPSITSDAIRECYHEEACSGGTNPERCCAAHYESPCECIYLQTLLLRHSTYIYIGHHQDCFCIRSA